MKTILRMLVVLVAAVLVCSAVAHPLPEEYLRVSKDEMETLWADLGSKDADKASKAQQKLLLAPRLTLTLLRERLKPVPEADEKRINELIGSLSKKNKKKEVLAEFEQNIDAAEPFVRKALAEGLKSKNAQKAAEKFL